MIDTLEVDEFLHLLDSSADFCVKAEFVPLRKQIFLQVTTQDELCSTFFYYLKYRKIKRREKYVGVELQKIEGQRVYFSGLKCVDIYNSPFVIKTLPDLKPKKKIAKALSNYVVQLILPIQHLREDGVVFIDQIQIKEFKLSTKKGFDMSKAGYYWNSFGGEADHLFIKLEDKWELREL